ncbi:hypothetical protein D3C76_1641030 [compost metagenome]
MPRISRDGTDLVSKTGRKRIPTRMAMAPSGTLIRKIQCQVAYSTSHPDSTGPRAGAKSMGIPSIPMMEPILSRGASRNTIAIPMGATIPPPIP